MKNNKIIRLVYFSADKFKDNNDDFRLLKNFGLSDPFIIPNEISFEDACKIVSFLSEQIADKISITDFYPTIINFVASELPKYGFIKINNHWSGFASNTTYDYPSASKLPHHWNTYYNKSNLGTNLFFVDGNFELFKENSKMFNDYFEWFIPNQSIDDIKRINNPQPQKQ